ncbi:trigger factor [Corallincola luteus]|uniref:Trigger factor n=1 Tax=Corallincola luteus TaxID=1775177 RepID=A0ABY2AIV1_9GAMM|nr:trigger factor [Corallincola luteus]TCI01621.1 trigger factor [Corallincola luteus]
MQVSVETTSGLERRLTISVPAEQVEKEVENRLRRLSKTQRIDGFRPGKVPVSVIRKRYSDAVRYEVAGELAQRNYFEAIMAEKIAPAGRPELAIVKNEAGADLEFTATIEVYPDFEVAGLETVEVEKPSAEVTDEDLANMIETLRKQHATFAEVTRAAAEGDKTFIDFVGTVDGEEFDGGKAENFELVIGAGRMIPGFEDAVAGNKAGDEVVANVTFPEDYHAENLKGKAAEFKIKINKIEGQELPEVNEEFAAKFGVGDGTVESFKTEVSKNMQRELGQALKNAVKEQVINGLLAANEVDLPKALVDQEIDALRQQALQRFGGAEQQNLPELPADLFTEQAERRVRTGLVLGELIKGNELEADEERVMEQINTLATAYEDPSEVVNYYKGNEELMQQMRNLALEDQAIDLVLSKAKVTEVTKTFDEVMNPAPNNA